MEVIQPNIEKLNQQIRNKIVLCAVLLFLIPSLYAQKQHTIDWVVSLQSGIEQHDKRKYRLEGMFTMPMEHFGTYHAGARIQRKLIGLKRFSLFGGLGFNYELATVRRTFNHCHFFDEGLCTDILLYQNRYAKWSTPVSIAFWFELTDNFYLSALVESNWVVYRHIGNSKVEGNGFGFPYYERTFEWEDLQCRLGLQYQWQHLLFGIEARAVNVQRIDKILFSPSIEESSEWYNPLRIDFTLGYSW